MSGGLPSPELARWMRERPPHQYAEWCFCPSCGRVAGWLGLGWLVFTAAMAALAIWIWRAA